MISTLINTLTAPSETFKTISEKYDFKQAVIPISLLMMFGKMVKAVNMILMQLAHLQRMATTLPMVPEILKNNKLLIPL